MVADRTYTPDEPMQAAIDALMALVRAHYPDATFIAGPGEDPGSVELVAVVDVDDPDTVMDIVVERLLTFLTVDRLALHFVPIRSPKRAAAARREAARRHPPPSIVPLLPV